MYIYPLYIKQKLMRKKNWVEFDNEPFLNEDCQIKSDVNKFSKIKVFKQLVVLLFCSESIYV